MSESSVDPLNVGHILVSEVARTSEVREGRCSVCFTPFSSKKPGVCLSKVILPFSGGPVLVRVESLVLEPLFVESPCLCLECSSLVFRIDDLEGRLNESVEKFRQNYRDRYLREEGSSDVADSNEGVDSSPKEGGDDSDVVRDEEPKRKKTRTSATRRKKDGAEEKLKEVQSRRKTKEIWEPLLGYYCELCCADFQRVETYSDHYRVTHPGLSPFVCAECVEEPKFMNHDELVDHEKEVHDGSGPEWRLRRNRRCRFCHKRFSCPETLKRHLVIFHMQEKMEFGCEECGQKFVTKIAMETHVKRDHSEERDFECSGHCSKRFPTERALKDHLYQVRKRQEASENLKLCPECGKGLKTERQLKDHLRVIHQNQRENHPCEICGKVYPWIADKKRHVRIAHGDPELAAPHVCSECSKRFQTKSALRQHLRRVHNIADDSLKVFKCVECDKEFFSKSKFNDHVEVHARQRKLVCSECGVQFKTQKSMDDHVLRNHSKRTDEGAASSPGKSRSDEKERVVDELEGFRVLAACPEPTEFAVALPDAAIVTPDGIYVVVRGTEYELSNISV